MPNYIRKIKHQIIEVFDDQDKAGILVEGAYFK